MVWNRRRATVKSGVAKKATGMSLVPHVEAVGFHRGLCVEELDSLRVCQNMIVTWGTGSNQVQPTRFLYGAALLCFVLLLLPGMVQAQCRTLFEQKKYQRAASCFVRLARRLSNVGPNRSRKARSLRNAATCYELAAKRQTQQDRRSYQLEQALLWLQYHNQQRLYDDQELRRQTQRRIRQIRNRIGYATLVVISNHPRSKICVKGYQWNRCELRTVWTVRLRPGPYSIQVTYLLSPVVTASRSLVLQRNGQETRLFTPPYESVSIVTNDPKAHMTLKGEGLENKLSRVGSLWSLQLPLGRYQLTVKYPHRPAKKRNIVVQAGKPVAQLFQRPPTIPILRVDSLPPRADVFIDRKLRGKTKLSLPLEKGTYNVRIQKPCYIPAEQSIQTEPNKENSLSMVLKRDPAYLLWAEKKNTEKTYKVLSWSTVGVGTAALLASIVLHVAASSHQTAALEALQQDAITGFRTYQELGQLGNGLRTGGYVSIALGTVALGLGLTGVFLSAPGPRTNIPCKVRFPARPKHS